jgi:hypothetical protein
VLDKGPFVPHEFVEELQVDVHPQGLFKTTPVQQGFTGKYAILFLF